MVYISSDKSVQERIGELTYPVALRNIIRDSAVGRIARWIRTILDKPGCAREGLHRQTTPFGLYPVYKCYKVSPKSPKSTYLIGLYSDGLDSDARAFNVHIKVRQNKIRPSKVL